MLVVCVTTVEQEVVIYCLTLYRRKNICLIFTDRMNKFLPVKLGDFQLFGRNYDFHYIFARKIGFTPHLQAESAPKFLTGETAWPITAKLNVENL